MPKKKATTPKKNALKKKTIVKKSKSPTKSLKAEKKISTKKKTVVESPIDFLQKENESLLISLISKEFDKELTKKSENYIRERARGS